MNVSEKIEVLTGIPNKVVEKTLKTLLMIISDEVNNNTDESFEVDLNPLFKIQVFNERPKKFNIVPSNAMIHIIKNPKNYLEDKLEKTLIDKLQNISKNII